MNSHDHLRSWSREWAAYRQLGTPQPPSATPATEAQSMNQTGAADLTISRSFGAAEMLWTSLCASIAPDLNQPASPALQLTASVLDAGARPSAAKSALQRGQILHLRPSLNTDWSREVHVLVLKVDQELDRALVVPFGPLPMPAFSAELATGLPDESLRVLCVWNACWLSGHAVRVSWETGSAPDALLADVESLRLSLKRKQALPEAVAERTGPPILHPEDPRKMYVAEEESLFDALLFTQA